MLLDVLILFVALFGKVSKDLVILEKLLDLPPAKFLKLGNDQLLTRYFREVWVLPAFFPREGKTETRQGYSQGTWYVDG